MGPAVLSRILTVLAALCMLTACDTTRSLRELRVMKPTGDDYAQALAANYRDYAERKVNDYEWEASRYFADKGLMAAYGRDIEPEKPELWDIPTTMLPEFTQARERLMLDVVASRTAQPEMAAAAVVAFDRWVEFQHYGWNHPVIEGRRDLFFATLSKLEELQQAAMQPQEEQGPPAPAAAPVESTSTVLYFPFNSYKLSSSALAALDEMVKYVKSSGNVTITINGHTDRVGAEDYNMELSLRRARYVAKALTTAGVSESIIKYFGFGETDPAVPTDDAVSEPKNRRVEIFIE